MRRVVVTGMGFATCLGLQAAEIVERLQNMRHGIRRYEPFLRKNYPVKVAAPVIGFQTDAEDPEDWSFPTCLHLKLDVLRGLSPHGLYAFYAVYQALAACGWTKEQTSDPRTGLYTASVGSPSRIYRNLEKMHRLGPQRCPPLGIVGSIAGTLTFNLAAAHRIKGASTGFVSACASSGHALCAAADEIAWDRQDRMLVVGAEDMNEDTVIPFVSMRVLSLSDNPDLASRPFDAARDGFVGTGGAVCLALEEESMARARGAPIMARLAGWGQATDGYHVAASHPDGDGLARAMGNALRHAGLSPAQIDYVNAHATATLHGDISELRALKRVFGADGHGPAVSSTKALTGHGLSLSSIMETAFCCLCLQHGFLPGSAHIENLDEEAKGVNVIRESQSARPRYVLSNSSGFGGANVSVILESV